MKININLTFDYELPLGSVESYEKGLFEPGGKLLALANQLGVPIVLFADICSAIRFKEWDAGYYDRFKSQIQSAIKDSHDVQLHIHPHWMDSGFENGRFIPSSKFSLNHFKEDPGLSIDKIIRLACAEMQAMCREVDPDYQCVAFRAGNYNVEPASKPILNSLYHLGIRYESSVIQGFYQNYPFSKIDYRHAPDTNFWKISKDGPLHEVATSASYLFECPITSMPNTLLNIFQRRMTKIRDKAKIQSRKYDNTGQGYAAISKNAGWLDKIRMALNPIVLSFDRDYMTVGLLEKIVNYNIQKFQNEKEIFLTLISHPKSMGSYHLNLMKDFVLLMQKKYGDDLSFVTYRIMLNKSLPV